MTDCTQTFLRTAITEVLPDLPEVSKDILEETLQNLGVETYDDFQFIEEADLLSALRPIQARKILAAWKLRCKYLTTGCSQPNILMSTMSTPLMRNMGQKWPAFISMAF